MKRSAKAAVMRPEYRPHREDAKKGKRSYRRNQKHRKQDDEGDL